MKAAITVASVFACAISLEAQITATLARLPDGSRPEIRIKNNAAVTLAAFATSMNPVARGADNAPLTFYFDTLIDTKTPLLPNQERAVPVLLRSDQPVEVLFEQPIITAGIFTDGRTTGDRVLLTRLILRRCNMLQAVETALGMISDAGRHNVSRDLLVGQFRKMADSLNRWYLPPDQQVGRSLYVSIAGKLMDLPDVQAGTPFPPADFVRQETAMLNQQRVTLLESQPSLADAALIRR